MACLNKNAKIAATGYPAGPSPTATTLVSSAFALAPGWGRSTRCSHAARSTSDMGYWCFNPDSSLLGPAVRYGPFGVPFSISSRNRPSEHQRTGVNGYRTPYSEGVTRTTPLCGWESARDGREPGALLSPATGPRWPRTPAYVKQRANPSPSLRRRPNDDRCHDGRRGEGIGGRIHSTVGGQPRR